MKAFLYRACAIIFSHFVLYPDYRISFFIPLAFRFADYTMIEVTTRTENVLEVIFAFYKRKLSELCNLNPQFFRDLRKYPKVLDYMREERKKCDSAILKYFNRGVEQGIFRPDINFDIINQAMVMQMDLLIYSDMLESYPLVEIYSEITLLHMRGITTRKGSEMVDAFLCQMKEKQFV